MRPAVRTQLLSTFRREFAKRQPNFVFQEPDEEALGIWVWNCAPSLTFFVAVSLFTDDYVFAIEIAWSDSCEFPWTSIGELMNIAAPCWRDRLGRLWQPHGREPVWDLAPEVSLARKARWDALAKGETVTYPPQPPIDEILPRIDGLVLDCLDKIEKFGLPLLARLAESRGLNITR